MPDIPPTWQSLLLNALQQNNSKPEARYIQVATVDEKQHPHVRTVVFRGFQNQTNLLFHSDVRSNKVHELKENPKCSVCWYFAQTREQFRIRATAQIVNYNDGLSPALLAEQWQNLSEAARAQYYAASPGSHFIPDDEGGAKQAISSTAPSENFCVVILESGFVDYLNLRGTPQTRLQYTKQPNETWLATAVNP